MQEAVTPLAIEVLIQLRRRRFDGPATHGYHVRGEASRAAAATLPARSVPCDDVCRARSTASRTTALSSFVSAALRSSILRAGSASVDSLACVRPGARDHRVRRAAWPGSFHSSILRELASRWSSREEHAPSSSRQASSRTCSCNSSDAEALRRIDGLTCPTPITARCLGDRPRRPTRSRTSQPSPTLDPTNMKTVGQRCDRSNRMIAESQYPWARSAMLALIVA